MGRLTGSYIMGFVKAAGLYGVRGSGVLRLINSYLHGGKKLPAVTRTITRVTPSAWYPARGSFTSQEVPLSADAIRAALRNLKVDRLSVALNERIALAQGLRGGTIGKLDMASLEHGDSGRRLDRLLSSYIHNNAHPEFGFDGDRIVERVRKAIGAPTRRGGYADQDPWF